MTTEQIVGLAIALLIMCIGCLGSLLPGIPSTPLVLIAAIAHKLYFKATGAGWIIMTMLVLITALALVMDYLASIYGAKRFGATKKGMAGAIVGGIVGLFFNLPGILFGPFIGASLFEMIGGRNWKPAMKAGLGATLGLFAGAVGKLVCCLSMMIFFAVNVLWRSFHAS
ncbi:MAG TPA: DUF456 domain-containing protein [Verrucomicrobiae bacterium]|jgi:hypothetical protein